MKEKAGDKSDIINNKFYAFIMLFFYYFQDGT
jgi:hypothetical protein